MPIEYRLPIDGLKFSTNKIYAGTHWSKRKSVKDSFLDYARVFCRPVQRPESYPVEIRYQFFFGSRPLDTLNTATMAKMLEDAFRALGILEEDDPAHVARSILEVNAIHRPKESKAATPPRAKGYAQNGDHLIVTITPYART